MQQPEPDALSQNQFGLSCLCPATEPQGARLFFSEASFRVSFRTGEWCFPFTALPQQWLLLPWKNESQLYGAGGGSASRSAEGSFFSKRGWGRTHECWSL